MHEAAPDFASPAPAAKLATAHAQLLTPAGLDLPALERVLHELSGPQVDYADLYFERSRGESWSLEDGIVKEGSHGIDQGVGVRCGCRTHGAVPCAGACS